jgi:hypothetical protein
MKASELSGAALDWAVAIAEGWQPTTARDSTGQYPWLIKVGKDINPKQYRPSTNWMQGGTIIEREGLAISRVAQDEWSASLIHEDKEYGGVMYTNEHGTTPLIAAMRCYVASKLGDDVEIPEGL